ncbi:MAG TPA: dihydroneopterin aldolase [Candidatus Elarobacter sp.]
MLDEIALRGIRAWGRHGADPGEQDVPQPFEIDLTLALDLRAARASDALDDTIDYAALHAVVVRIVAGERYRLLERLGEQILSAVMDDRRIVRASIAIAKPAKLSGATPVVTLRRERA